MRKHDMPFYAIMLLLASVVLFVMYQLNSALKQSKAWEETPYIEYECPNLKIYAKQVPNFEEFSASEMRGVKLVGLCHGSN